MNHSRPPTPRPRPARRGLIGTLIEDASAVVESVAVEVAPGVIGVIDIQAIVDRIDMNELLERVDLNEVLERVDVNELLRRVDITVLLAKLDPQTIVLLANAVMLQLDLNGAVDRIDLNRVVDKLDVDAIVNRIDMNAVVEKMELGTIVSQASTSVAGEAIDGARSAGVGLDEFLHRWIDRLLRRDPSPVGGPPLLVGATAHEAPKREAPEEREEAEATQPEEEAP